MEERLRSEGRSLREGWCVARGIDQANKNASLWVFGNAMQRNPMFALPRETEDGVGDSLRWKTERECAC
jgi:hypothetical protein